MHKFYLKLIVEVYVILILNHNASEIRNGFVFLFRLSSFGISFAYSIFNMVRKLNEKCYTFFSKEIEVENNTLNMLLLPYWTFT